MSRMIKVSSVAVALVAMSMFATSAMARGGGGGGGGRGGGGGGGARAFSGGGGGGRSIAGGGGGRSSSPSVSSRGFDGGRSLGSSNARNFDGGRSFNNFSNRSYAGSNFNRGSWNNNNWSGHNGNWDNNYWGHNNWNNGWHDHGWNNGWWWGIAPLIGYWGGYSPWYYGGYDSYGYYPYGGYYYGGYPYSTYYETSPGYYNTESVSYPSNSAPSQPPQPPTTSSDEQGGYMSEAIAAFQQGDFAQAMRMASHAAIDMPRDPQAHLIICLSAMANQDYRTAAAEAHAVVALGNLPSWAQVYNLYGNLDTFTNQLRAVENSVKQNRQDPAGNFLLGFLYLIEGYRTDAQEHLQVAVQAVPQDRIAQTLLTDAGGQAPVTASRERGDISRDGSGSRDGNGSADRSDRGDSRDMEAVPSGRGQSSDRFGPPSEVPSQRGDQPAAAPPSRSGGSDAPSAFPSDEPPAPPSSR